MSKNAIPNFDELVDALEFFPEQMQRPDDEPLGKVSELFDEETVGNRVADAVYQVFKKRTEVIVGGNGGAAERLHVLARDTDGWVAELFNALTKAAGRVDDVEFAEHPSSPNVEYEDDFDSSNVQAFGIYGRTLYVRFHSTPGAYLYFDTPPSIYVDMQGADSKGRFVNEQLKGEFDYLHVDTTETDDV